jgi:RNA binding exosome subunit
MTGLASGSYNDACLPLSKTMSLFYYITFRTYCHATESLEKVERALKFVSHSENISKSKLSGYYGNPITVMEAKLETANEFKEFFKCLGDTTAQTLKNELALRVDDECNLYLRLDKQKAFEGDCKLSEGEDTIAVKCKLKVFPPKKEIAILKLREFLENL